jgi:DNA-binding transcriptional ArsR family regulator
MSANVAPSLERLATLEWTARVGAVTADALAELRGASLASARAHLGSLTRAGLLARRRLLVGEPSLYTVTGAGLRRVEAPWSDPRRVSIANAPHTFACARAAAALQRGYPDHVLIGERELRHRERVARTPLASAALIALPGLPQLHRPDLVLWPIAPGRLPVAVEIELTVKAPRRLAEICRAWDATSGVAGVLYLAPPSVRRALARAIALTGAERIVVLSLDSLAPIDARGTSIARTVPS